MVAPLIGREVEVQQLLGQLYAMIEDDEARLVTVLGSQGVGKSRLAYELREHVSRLPEAIQFFALQADASRSAQPYGLIRSMVLAFFRIAEESDPQRMQRRFLSGVQRLLGTQALPQAQILGHFLGLSSDPIASELLHDAAHLREQAMMIAHDCVVKLSQQAPMVLVIDDLHLADAGSLDVLNHLVHWPAGLRMLLVGLARHRLLALYPAWGEHLHTQKIIDLQPLNERDSRRLVGEILRKAGKLPADLRSLIVQRAEGNPLFVEELIKMLIDDGIVRAEGDVWQIRAGRLARLRAPASLSELISARIASLDPNERAILDAAAVVGRTFWLAALPPRLPIDQAVLNALQQRELIVLIPEPRFPGVAEYQFRHGLIHEVAYQRLAAEQRRQGHAYAAAWLSQQAPEQLDDLAALIAEHYREAGDGIAAADWYQRAAAHAHAGFALDQAYSLLKQAVAAIPEVPEHGSKRIVLLEELADLAFISARYNDGLDLFERLRKTALMIGDRAAEARALMGLARAYDNRTDYQSTYRYAEEALAVAREVGDARLLGTAFQRMGWALVRLERNHEALEYAAQARAIFAGSEPPLPEQLARTYVLQGMAAEALNDFTAAVASMEQASTIYRELGSLRELATALNNLGYIHNARGDWLEAIAVLEEDLMIAREIGFRNNEIYALSNLCLSLANLGELDRADEVIQQGVAMCELSRVPVFIDFHKARVLVALQRQQPAEALEAAQHCLALAQSSGNPREQGEAWRSMGMSFAAQADTSAVQACFSESLRLLESAGATVEVARTRRAWGQFAAQSGDRAAAHEYYQAALAIFQQVGLPLEVERTGALLAA